MNALKTFFGLLLLASVVVLLPLFLKGPPQ
jgi:thiol:disulfide interchange protein